MFRRSVKLKSLSVNQDFCKEILVFTLTGKYLRGIVFGNIFEPFKTFPMVMLHSWIKDIDNYLLIKAQYLTDYVAARWEISQLRLAKMFIAGWFTLLLFGAMVALSMLSYYLTWATSGTYLVWITSTRTAELFKRISDSSQEGNPSPEDKRLLDMTRIGFMLFLVSSMFLLLWFFTNNPSFLLDVETVAMSPIFILSVFLPTFAYYIMSCKPVMITKTGD